MTGGRCHGPDCTNPAVIGEFCGELCQARWNAELVGLPGPVEGDSNIRDVGEVEALRREVDRLTELHERPGDLPLWEQEIAESLLHLTDDHRVIVCHPEVERRVRDLIALTRTSGSFEVQVSAAVPGGKVIFQSAESEVPALESAAFPQVAPVDPQVGWLSRLFHRVFGRTT